MYLILIALLIFLSILLIRTFSFKSKQIHLAYPPELATISDQAPQRLAQAIAIKSIANQDTFTVDPLKIKEVHELIVNSFPQVHNKLQKETVNELSLLYYWKGKDPSLKPLLLLAHMDVVPANPEEWSVDPYEGVIKDGYVWGRGALDDKLSLMGILEAAELLLSQGFEPERSIYFAFGHDEEIRGLNGAKKLADLLASRNIQFEAILDEGGVVINNAVPGIDKPVAVLGIAEKGYLSCELSTEAEGGHSSMPPSLTAIGRLCTAISRLGNNPFPASIKGPSLVMYDYVGPEMPFSTKLIFSNLWLFIPLLIKKLTSSPSTNASVRTTIASTMIQGGTKENILPTQAKAIINMRLLPGDTVENAIEHIKKSINDNSIKISAIPYGYNATPVSPTDTKQFQLIQKTIKEVFPSSISAPYLVLGTTDARFYTSLSKNVFRFLPVHIDKEDLNRIHGKDERVSIENYKRLIQFYVQFIKNFQLT